MNEYKSKVAMLVMNPCNPDPRVIKEAESLVKSGYCVRVFCLKTPKLPAFEIKNGVEYQRMDILLSTLSGLKIWASSILKR